MAMRFRFDMSPLLTFEVIPTCRSEELTNKTSRGYSNSTAASLRLPLELNHGTVNAGDRDDANNIILDDFSRSFCSRLGFNILLPNCLEWGLMGSCYILTDNCTVPLQLQYTLAANPPP